MVDLVKMLPQKIYRMSPTVPPVKYKCGNEIGDQASRNGMHMIGQMKNGVR
jgi:hypothetical protein